MTRSMAQAIEETARRRAKQIAYNLEHGITPQSIMKSVDMKLAAIVEADYVQVSTEDSLVDEFATEEQLRQAIADLEIQMRDAAKKFEFEQAAALRDRIRALKQRTVEMYVPVEAAAAEAASHAGVGAVAGENGAAPAPAPEPAATPELSAVPEPAAPAAPRRRKKR